jgi:hypothetical protein
MVDCQSYRFQQNTCENKRRKTNQKKKVMHISLILLTNNREIVSFKKKFENKSFFTRICHVCCIEILRLLVKQFYNSWPMCFISYWIKKNCKYFPVWPCQLTLHQVEINALAWLNIMSTFLAKYFAESSVSIPSNQQCLSSREQCVCHSLDESSHTSGHLACTI